MSRPVKATKLSNAQRDQLTAQFQAITGTTIQDATKVLKKYNYNINNAVDAFFSNPAGLLGGQSAAASAQKLGQVFDKYKDPDGDRIGIDGTIKLCQDLDVSPEDVVLLAIAYECKCPGVGEFTREGWIAGLQSLNCDSIDSLRRALPSLRQRLLTDPDYFRSVYLSTFTFAKAPDSRVLPLETALDYQRLLILPALALGQRGALASQNPPGFGEREFGWWEEFLGGSGVKAMTKDVWNNFIDFVKQIDAGFLTHDLDAAWPSVIDDFVEYAKKRAVTGGGADMQE